MAELTIFKNEQFGEIRTLIKDGEPWFVAADVCRALELGNPTETLKRLDDDEKNNTLISTEGIQGNPNVNIINESGLYNLVLGSRKPEAKQFKRWITHEVIPSIRKHGAYMTPEKLDEIFANPDTLLRLVTQLKEETDRRKSLEIVCSDLSVANAIAQPKAQYFDMLVERNLLTNFRETAQELGIGQKELINKLLDWKYLYRNKRGKLCPMADKNDGLFEVREFVNEKTGFAATQTLLTPKGRETIRLLIHG